MTSGETITTTYVNSCSPLVMRVYENATSVMCTKRLSSKSSMPDVAACVPPSREGEFKQKRGVQQRL